MSAEGELAGRPGHGKPGGVDWAPGYEGFKLREEAGSVMCKKVAPGR